MIKSRRKNSKEFKEEAVQLYLNSGRTMKEVADGLGIEVYHLSTWKKEYLSDETDAFPGKGNRKGKDDELFKLQKEIADLKMENEILKKAVAIFTRSQR